jgi:hypothetical protein
VLPNQQLFGNRLLCDNDDDNNFGFAQRNSLSSMCSSNPYFTDVCCDDDNEPKRVQHNDQHDPFADFDFDCTLPPSTNCMPINDCQPLNSTRTTDPYCTDVVCDPNCRPFSTRPRPQTPRYQRPQYQRPQYQRPQYQRPSPYAVGRNTCSTDTTAALDQVIRLAEQKVKEAEHATEAARQAEEQSLKRQKQQLECSITELNRKQTLLAQQTLKVNGQAQKVTEQLETAKKLQKNDATTKYGSDAASYVANAIAACEAAVRQNDALKTRLQAMTDKTAELLKEHEQRKTKINDELNELTGAGFTGGDLDEFESQDEDSSVQGGRIVNESLEVDLDA